MMGGWDTQAWPPHEMWGCGLVLKVSFLQKRKDAPVCFWYLVRRLGFAHQAARSLVASCCLRPAQ